MVTKTLDVVLMSYRGAHMLIGLLPEVSHPNSFHIVR